jgi:hypothetical protein
LLTGAAFAAALRLTEPEFPVPGSVTVGVTPAGSPLTFSVTLPVKLVRVTVMETLCDPPPAVTVTDPPALMAMLGAAVTVTLKFVVALDTPLPLAVTVTLWLVTGGALAAAERLMDPEFPVPG